jgi:SAM-dependent methyltransferase
MRVYGSKLDWIARFVRPDSRVLDLGCVCHDLNQTAVPWLHGFLSSRAREVQGVDLVADDVARMNQQGYRAVVGDVQTLQLGERFDLVVAGDIIEHLDAPGAMLQRAADHLADDGMLLVTTPNPITLLRYLRVFLKGKAGANKQHTCWFTAKVLGQLADRNGLEVVEEAYIDDSRLYHPWLKPVKSTSPRRVLSRQASRLVGMAMFWKPMGLIQSLLCRLRPRLSETLCLAMRKKQSSADA